MLHTPHCPLRSAPSGTIVAIAQWKKFEIKKAHVYSLVAWPTAKLAVGAQIRILALSNPQYHIPFPTPTQYDSYDPHIFGCISRILPSTSGGLALVTVVNECRRNMVTIVELEVPNVENMLSGGGALSTHNRKLALRAVKSLLPLEKIAPPGMGSDCLGLGCVAPGTASFSISDEEEAEWSPLSDIEEEEEDVSIRRSTGSGEKGRVVGRGD
ncbi:hypothetical protein C8Q80DRAFT_1116813 [Daedaleopsis nitida]|nr:hypothetical protein C8Q80DRAFT_1116813 [Daedaleopsis nitida]